MRFPPAPAARLALVALAAAGSGALALTPADAASGLPAIAISSNWAGYAIGGATSPRASARRFRRVSGSWVQPAASCTSGRPSFSAVWVGLGGFNTRSRGLEQIGTEADCTRAPAPAYSAWFELVPAAPIDVALAVHPGDQISASVTVSGRAVALHLRDMTTRASFDTTRRVPRPDTSSAEWIVEAPSICTGQSICSTLALTDFGTLRFTSAVAAAGRRVGALDDAAWARTELELQQGAAGARGPRSGPRFAGGRSPIAARPSPVREPDGSFSVTWGERPTAAAPSQVTLPSALGA